MTAALSRSSGGRGFAGVGVSGVMTMTTGQRIARRMIVTTEHHVCLQTRTTHMREIVGRFSDGRDQWVDTLRAEMAQEIDRAIARAVKASKK